MAKSLGGGFPIGAFWTRAPFADVLGPGTHATTFGGTPLACAVALKVLEVIERDHLERNARETGDYFLGELRRFVRQYPRVVKDARGLGFMLGITLANDIPGLSGNDKGASIQFANRLHEAGLLAIPAGAQVIRFLPPLNLGRHEAEEGIRILESVIKQLA
jgi:acetylornithine/succinyldiaminopimelate/putrescine aminotransferase